MSNDEATREIGRLLAEPFAEDVVHWKPQTVKDNRALAVAYIDARDVMDRLDEVLGVAGWKDQYVPLGDGNVRCLLSCRLPGGEWISKEDVGGESEQKDQGDKTKAAFSDALKRAAVKWGIGRYLYSLPHSWHDYDPMKKRFVNRPTLPNWAKPNPPRPEAKPPAAPVPPPPTPTVSGRPANGAELVARLADKEAKLMTDGLCKKGELLTYVLSAGVKEGLERDMTTWGGAAIDLAIAAVKSFEAMRRATVTALRNAPPISTTTPAPPPLWQWLNANDALMAGRGWTKPGDMIAAVTEALADRLGDDPEYWAEKDGSTVRAWVMEFEARVKPAGTKQTDMVKATDHGAYAKQR